MNGTLAKGTAVVSLQDGAKVGTIDRVYVDPERGGLVALAIRRGRRLLRPTTAVVDASDVHAFGPDAVTLAGPVPLLSDAVLAGRWEELVDVTALFGRPVVTEGGSGVGRVASVMFDRKTRRLRWLEVEADGCPVPGLVWADEVLRLGSELVVVAEAVLADGPAAAARPVMTRETSRPALRRPLQFGPARPLRASA